MRIYLKEFPAGSNIGKTKKGKSVHSKSPVMYGYEMLDSSSEYSRAFNSASIALYSTVKEGCGFLRTLLLILLPVSH